MHENDLIWLASKVWWTEHSQKVAKISKFHFGKKNKPIAMCIKITKTNKNIEKRPPFLI